jgi:hypothetical protein
VQAKECKGVEQAEVARGILANVQAARAKDRASAYVYSVVLFFVGWTCALTGGRALVLC